MFATPGFNAPTSTPRPSLVLSDSPNTDMNVGSEANRDPDPVAAGMSDCNGLDGGRLSRSGTPHTIEVCAIG